MPGGIRWEYWILRGLRFGGTRSPWRRFLDFPLRNNRSGNLKGKISDQSEGYGKHTNSQERTDLLPFFGGCEDVGVNGLGSRCVGGFEGFVVDFTGGLVDAVVLLGGAAEPALSATCTKNISSRRGAAGGG